MIKKIHITPGAEELIEFSARLCYNSNMSDNLKDRRDFIKKLINKGHESVLEHAHATFLFLIHCSRTCSHQLVRHRLASYSQQSQRYVNEENFEHIIPDSMIEGSPAWIDCKYIMKDIKLFYNELINKGIPKEDARYILPNATLTKIVVTANFRQWRHIIKLRTHKSAQWEIREIMEDVLDLLYEDAPSVFEDLIPEERRKE